MMLITRNELCPECRGDGCDRCGETGTLDGHLQASHTADELAKTETTEGVVIAALDEALQFVALLPGRDAERVAYLVLEALERLGVEEAQVIPAPRGCDQAAQVQRWALARMEARS